MSENAVIETAGLVKSFGATTALDGLDLQVAQGEVHGFLGPNGAGKSTTMRILLGLLRGDRGVARVFGADPWEDAVALHRRLAWPHDVDVLVVGDVDREAVFAAADRAQARLGVPVNTVVRSLRRWEEASDGLVREIQGSPVVVTVDRTTAEAGQ